MIYPRQENIGYNRAKAYQDTINYLWLNMVFLPEDLGLEIMMFILQICSIDINKIAYFRVYHKYYCLHTRLLVFKFCPLRLAHQISRVSAPSPLTQRVSCTRTPVLGQASTLNQVPQSRYWQMRPL